MNAVFLNHHPALNLKRLTRIRRKIAIKIKREKS